MERFFSKTVPGPGGCLLWATGKTRKGYGQFNLNGKTVYAHRFAWELHAGVPVPEGHEVNHKCHVRACVNWEHLEALTPEKHYEVDRESKVAAGLATRKHRDLPVGVTRVGPGKRWFMAQVSRNGRRLTKGARTVEEAAAAYAKLRKELYG